MRGFVNTRGATSGELQAVLSVANGAKAAADAAASDSAEAKTAATNAQKSANAALQAITDLTSTINTVPTQGGALVYNGSSQTPMWNGFDTEKLTIGGQTSGTNAGTYTATFTPKEGFKWSDGSTDAVSVTWTIGRASVTIPSQSGSLTYNGSSQTPSWSNYDSNKLTIGGTTSDTNAGTYSATFTPKSNYQWSDGTTSAKTVNWSIGKASGSLSLNPASLTLDVSALTKTIAVTRAGTGAIHVTSSNTGVATVSLSGTTITVTAQNKGSATITVTVDADSNYTAPSSKTCAVTVSLPSKTLSENTPAVIKQAAQAGTASTYWKVGDKIGIALNGTVGALALNGTYYAFIIGFNHNSSREGGNSIHFQFGKTSAGVDIAFCDSKYNTTGSDAAFRMNTSNTNSGGWNNSYMRKTICPALLSAMPTAWQNVIAACNKYSDNTGGGSDNASYVTSTSDKIWLLSEFEVQGTRTYANSAEKNYQAQYDYYKNGNSKIKYRHDSTGSACFWWLRSVDSGFSYGFCAVNTGGGADYGNAYRSRGFAPGFKVA